MKADNLYAYQGNGDLYCLVIDDSDYRGTDGTWEPGVIYVGTDGRMRSTTKARWEDRFKPVAEYAGDDEAVIAMIRRTNLPEFDLGDVVTAWHESESQITSELLRLMAATVAVSGRFNDPELPQVVLSWDDPASDGVLSSVALTIQPRDLAYVSANYAIEWEPDQKGYRFSIRK